MTTIERLAVFSQVLFITFAGFVLLLALVRFCVKYGNNITPVFIDGLLFTLLAVWTAMMGIYQSDEIYKYCSPYFVFYSKSMVSIMLAGATALKAFRSTSYSEHVKEKAREKVAVDLQAQTQAEQQKPQDQQTGDQGG